MPIRRNAARAAAPILLFLLLLAGGAGSRCLAAEAVAVDVGSVYASSEGSSVDPALANIRGKLRAMFDYSNYKMLDRKRKTLAVGETGDFGLPGGRTMQVKPLPAEGRKVRLSVQIREGGKSLLATTLGLSRGGMVLVGGPSHEAGVLIFIISAD